MRTALSTLAMTLLVSQGVVADDNSNLAVASGHARPQAQPAKPAPANTPLVAKSSVKRDAGSR
ncbi:hypothetical protein JQX08_20890 [Pseudomonas sp. UL073]|uniref:Uncharacterized protein n=1 Tax=Zestomonas insulae TaxID=2809017 RepID=A0ABS2IJP2_9GAMM|nr:hypothetical protein [Pseudomonas insulae]MBM7063182.1 hypothetical protein [Pseudomonas insulae]